MKRMAPIAAGAALLLLLGGFFLLVRIPAGEVGVVLNGQPGAVPASIAPGFHLRPFGATVVRYSTAPATASDEVLVTPASGGEIPSRFQVTARLDPQNAGALHAAIAGRTMEEFLVAQVGSLLREYASRAEAVEILTPQFREKAAADLALRLRQGGLAEATIKLRPPDDATLLAAAQFLAPRREAFRIRQSVAEAMGEPGAEASWKLLTAMGLVNESERLFTDAERNYLDALALEPAAMPPMTELVVLYSRVNEWNKLARVLDAALSARPDSIQHINWMAMALLKLEDHEGAESILKRGLGLEPGNATLSANLGALYMKMGRIEEALALFRKAVDSAPTSSQALFNLGSALAGTDRFAEALPYLQRAEESGQPSYALARTLALVYEKTGDRARAASYRDKARKLEADERARRQKVSTGDVRDATSATGQGPS